MDLGQSTTFSVLAAGDAKPLGYSYQNLPSGCVSANASSLSCTPGSSGSYLVNATVNDTHRDNATANVSITVQLDPLISQFRVAPAASVTSGTPIQFNVSATSGSPGYAYAYKGLPSGCVSKNVFNLSCQPLIGGNASVNFTVQVTVTDVAGWPVVANLTLTVNPLPEVASFHATRGTLDIGETTIFQLNATGGSAPYDYAYSALPLGCASQDVAALTCQPTGPPRLYSVLGSVTDAFGWSSNSTVNITVNPALVILSSASSVRTTDAGTSVTFWVNATGGTAPLVYSYRGLPAGCGFSSQPTGSCLFNSPGNSTIVASVTDLTGATINTTILLSVVPDPQVATFTATPNVTDIGVPTTLNVTVSGGVGPFSYDWARLPPGCHPSVTSWLICTPSAPGNYPVTVTATDLYKKSGAQTLAVVVDVRPVVLSFNVSTMNVTLGDKLFLGISATGGTGGYQYSYSSLPVGCVGAGNASFNCTPSATGVYNMTVRITDAVSANAFANATVTVKARPAPPSGGIFPTLTGSSTNSHLLLGALIVVLAALVAVALLAMRRRRGNPPAPPPASSASSEPAEPSTEEPPVEAAPPNSPSPPAPWDEQATEQPSSLEPS
ncbi:MAG: hypothetical protein L3K09_08685, partial [Thermoplasmata archaeon]|nr:hypothetical protein [Thermoplasmata archaeon]